MGKADQGMAKRPNTKLQALTGTIKNHLPCPTTSINQNQDYLLILTLVVKAHKK